MLGTCAMAGAAPRSVHKPTRPAVHLLNTTLPVPEVAAAPVASGAGRERASGDRSMADRSMGDHGTGAFPIQWRESREIAGPEIISRIRNYKRDGLPVVQLWESQQSRVAIGLNPHGVPGIYFTHHVGG